MENHNNTKHHSNSYLKNTQLPMVLQNSSVILDQQMPTLAKEHHQLTTSTELITQCVTHTNTKNQHLTLHQTPSSWDCKINNNWCHRTKAKLVKHTAKAKANRAWWVPTSSMISKMDQPTWSIISEFTWVPILGRTRGLKPRSLGQAACSPSHQMMQHHHNNHKWLVEAFKIIIVNNIHKQHMLTTLHTTRGSTAHSPVILVTNNHPS